jgi:hypothetical protein
LEIVEISAKLLWCSQNHFAAGARPSMGATPCSFLAAATFVVIGENRQALDAGKNGEGFKVVGRARRPHRLQQCAAMHNPGRGIERGLNTFGKAKPLRHLFIRPQPNNAAAHRPKRSSFLAILDRTAPNPARLRTNRVGVTRDDARQIIVASPRAACMPAQTTMVGDAIEHDAALAEIALAGSPYDRDAFVPDACCQGELPRPFGGIITRRRLGRRISRLIVEQTTAAQFVEHIARVASGIAVHKGPSILPVADVQARMEITATATVRRQRAAREVGAVGESLRVVRTAAEQMEGDGAGVHALPPWRRAPQTKSLPSPPSARAFATSRRTRLAGSSANARRYDGTSKCGESDAVAIKQVVRASRVSPTRSSLMRTSGSVTMLASAISVTISLTRWRLNSSSYSRTARA